MKRHAEAGPLARKRLRDLNLFHRLSNEYILLIASFLDNLSFLEFHGVDSDIHRILELEDRYMYPREWRLPKNLLDPGLLKGFIPRLLADSDTLELPYSTRGVPRLIKSIAKRPGTLRELTLTNPRIKTARELGKLGSRLKNLGVYTDGLRGVHLPPNTTSIEADNLDENVFAVLEQSLSSDDSPLRELVCVLEVPYETMARLKCPNLEELELVVDYPEEKGGQEASFSQWLSGLKKLKKLSLTIEVPGHAPLELPNAPLEELNLGEGKLKAPFPVFKQFDTLKDVDFSLSDLTPNANQWFNWLKVSNVEILKLKLYTGRTLMFGNLPPNLREMIITLQGGVVDFRRSDEEGEKGKIPSIPHLKKFHMFSDKYRARSELRVSYLCLMPDLEELTLNRVRLGFHENNILVVPQGKVTTEIEDVAPYYP